MDELTTKAKSLIERARPAFTPSAEQLEQLRGRLASTLEAPPDADDPGSEGGHGARWRWPVGTALVVGLLAAGSLLVGRGQGEPIERVNPPAVGSSAGDRPLYDERPAPALVPPSPPPSPATGSSAGAAASPPRAQRRRSAVAPEPSRPEEHSSFAVELELITGARRALKARRYRRARDTAADYTRRFPHGSFGEEAEVLELIARCGLGRSETLSRRAQAYVSTHEAFALRVRKACLQPEPATRSAD